MATGMTTLCANIQDASYSIVFVVGIEDDADYRIHVAWVHGRHLYPPRDPGPGQRGLKAKGLAYGSPGQRPGSGPAYRQSPEGATRRSSAKCWRYEYYMMYSFKSNAIIAGKTTGAHSINDTARDRPAPSGLSKRDPLTQGAALGYHGAPFQG